MDGWPYTASCLAQQGRVAGVICTMMDGPAGPYRLPSKSCSCCLIVNANNQPTWPKSCMAGRGWLSSPVSMLTAPGKNDSCLKKGVIFVKSAAIVENYWLTLPYGLWGQSSNKIKQILKSFLRFPNMINISCHCTINTLREYELRGFAIENIPCSKMWSKALWWFYHLHWWSPMHWLEVCR